MQNNKTDVTLTFTLNGTLRSTLGKLAESQKQSLAECLAAHLRLDSRVTSEPERPLLLNPRHDETVAGDYERGKLKRNRDGKPYLARTRYNRPLDLQYSRNHERYFAANWEPIRRLEDVEEIIGKPYFPHMVQESVMLLSDQEAALWIESDGRVVPARRWLDDSGEEIASDGVFGTLRRLDELFFVVLTRGYEQSGTDSEEWKMIRPKASGPGLTAFSPFHPEMIGFRYVVLSPRLAAKYYRALWVDETIRDFFQLPGADPSGPQKGFLVGIG